MPYCFILALKNKIMDVHFLHNNPCNPDSDIDFKVGDYYVYMTNLTFIIYLCYKTYIEDGKKKEYLDI